MAVTDRTVGLVDEIRERIERARPEACPPLLGVGPFERIVARGQQVDYEIGMKTGALVALAWAMRSWGEYLQDPQATVEGFIEQLCGTADDLVAQL